MQSQNENLVQKIDLLSMSKGLVGKYNVGGSTSKKKFNQKTNNVRNNYLKIEVNKMMTRFLIKVKKINHILNLWKV